MVAPAAPDDPVPPPAEYIERVFGHGGYLARRFGASYVPRAPQVELARAVDRALTGRTHLLSEAPTGTGKSLAYSVPATYHAATRGDVVVIVTANIALQEQVVGKDLPMLAEVLPWRFSYGLLKGRANYLCRARYEQQILSGTQQEFGGLGASQEDRDRARLMRWASEQVADEGDGDRSDLGDWSPPGKLWGELSVGPDDCPGKRCAFADACGALRAQRRAREAQVVVTNYHVYFTNLLVYLDRGVDAVLPPHDAVVWDECHAAADIAREYFGWQVTERSVKRAVAYVRSVDPDAHESALRAAGWFFEQMRKLRWDKGRYGARVVGERLSGDDVASATGLVSALARARARVELDLLDPDAERQSLAELALRRVDRLSGAVGSVVSGGDDNEVVSLEEDDSRAVRVVCRLVEPAQVLRGGVFGKTVERLVGDEAVDLPVAVVCTSATVTTGDFSFDFARREIGAGACETLVVPSPFDYASQALLVLPPVCDPSDPRFTAEVAETFLRTVELARGRTLALFTSRKRMNDVYDRVAGRTPFRLMRQDDGQRTHLVDEFRRDVHSVLMGVASFWAGVDVPGESLSCVFIDKLPFPTPDDPVLDKLTEVDRRAWGKYAVPRAIIALRQGFGRLIRTTTDRGVVVCCDGRLLTKSYGKQFLRALPSDMQKVRSLDAVREWLDGPQAVDPLS